MNAQQYPVKFIEYLLYERGFSPLTAEAYGRDISQFIYKNPNYLGMERERLDDYSDELCDLEPASVARKLAALKSFYKFLYQEEIIAKNPALDIALPKLAKRLPKTLSRKETGTILEQGVQTYRDRAMLELLYSAGLRVSELTGIKLVDLNTAEGFLKVCGKGSKERLVPLSTQAVTAINVYIKEERRHLKNPEEQLFLSCNGRALTRQAVWQIVKKASADLHKKVSPHSFRHSLATHLIENGADIRTVQELLGHANIATTEIYTAVSREHLRRVYAKAHPGQEQE